MQLSFLKKLIFYFINRTYLISRYIIKYKCTKILDIGCGNGELAKYLPKNLELYGMDIKPVINEKLIKERYKFIQHDVTKPFPLPDNYFDCVVANALLEHIPNFTNTLLEAKRVLKKNGIFIISVSNPQALGRFLYNFHSGFLNIGKGSTGKWRTAKDHVALFGLRKLGEAKFHYAMPYEWKLLLEKYGFSIMKSEGVGIIKFPSRLADIILIIAKK